MIIEENLFEPIVELFLKNGNKYNLIESALLELFEWIVKKNIKPIVKYLMEKFYDRLKTIPNLPLSIFQNLKDLHEKNDYTPATPEETSTNTEIPPVLTDVRQKARQRFREERVEEDWFNSENDDDEDDEDYTPPIYHNNSSPLESSIPTTEFKERSKKRSVEDDLDLAFNLIKEKKLKKPLLINGKQSSPSFISSQVGEKRESGVKIGEKKS
jgi:hypothetical protein